MLAGGIGDIGFELYEAQTVAAEIVDGLDGDLAENIRIWVEGVGFLGLEGEGMLESFQPGFEGREGEELGLGEVLRESDGDSRGSVWEGEGGHGGFGNGEESAGEVTWAEEHRRRGGSLGGGAGFWKALFVMSSLVGCRRSQ